MKIQIKSQLDFYSHFPLGSTKKSSEPWSKLNLRLFKSTRFLIKSTFKIKSNDRRSPLQTLINCNYSFYTNAQRNELRAK